MSKWHKKKKKKYDSYIAPNPAMLFITVSFYLVDDKAFFFLKL